MAAIGHLVGGKFVKDLGSFDIDNLPEATETSSGLMSSLDKVLLNNSYNMNDIATTSEILSEVFNK